MLEEVQTFFGNRMFQTVIRLNVTLKRAVSEGVSIIDFDKTSNGARDYTALCHELLRLEGVEHLERPVASSVSVQAAREEESVLLAQERMEKSFAPDLETVTFTVEAPAANEIYVVGDFNDWKMNDESRLARCENGYWEKRLGLPHGRYRYKFVVDGEWKTDSRNQECEGNEFGTLNSVMSI